jgi:hypothetical protein
MLEAWSRLRGPARADRRLLEVMRALPSLPASLEAGAGEIVQRAELHGLSDVVFDAWREGGVYLDDALARAVLSRRVARELDHEAHLAMLGRIDGAFERAGLRGVLLKGALFAERYYPRPAARGTTDIDLLVREADLEAAAAALATIGYRASEAASEARFRREHHHLHFHHPGALPLELHFHAYRGFGEVMRSEPLIARSVPSSRHHALRVLAPEDELVYLAVHAAAHRFGRLSWLYDIKLLIAAMTPAQIAVAGERARELGFARAVAFAAHLLASDFGVDPAKVAPLGDAGRVRDAVVAVLAPEPPRPLVRSATRLAYTVALCDSPSAVGRYVKHATLGHARRILGLDP